MDSFFDPSLLPPRHGRVAAARLRQGVPAGALVDSRARGRASPVSTASVGFTTLGLLGCGLGCRGGKWVGGGGGGDGLGVFGFFHPVSRPWLSPPRGDSLQMVARGLPCIRGLKLFPLSFWGFGKMGRGVSILSWVSRVSPVFLEGRLCLCVLL